MLATKQNHAMQNRWLTTGLMAVTAAIAVVLICERLERHPVIPLHDGQVLIRDGAVVIEESGEMRQVRDR